MKVTISLGQMDVKTGDVAANLETAARMAAEASRRGSDLLVLPELWATGHDLENAAEHASPVDRGVFAETAALARLHGIYILCTSLSDDGKGMVGDTSVIFDTQGTIEGIYRKLHLFAPLGEARYLSAGDKLTVVNLPWGLTGLAICYDLRFPEITRSFGTTGAVLVLLPSAWPYPRLAHWRILLRARAIENQLFVAACNRVGNDGETKFFGHSTVIDPSGETVIEGGTEEALLTAVINTEQIEPVRALFNVFEDRRPECYTGW